MRRGKQPRPLPRAAGASMELTDAEITALFANDDSPEAAQPETGAPHAGASMELSDAEIAALFAYEDTPEVAEAGARLAGESMELSDAEIAALFANEVGGAIGNTPGEAPREAPAAPNQLTLSDADIAALFADQPADGDEEEFSEGNLALAQAEITALLAEAAKTANEPAPIVEQKPAAEATAAEPTGAATSIEPASAPAAGVAAADVASAEGPAVEDAAGRQDEAGTALASEASAQGAEGGARPDEPAAAILPAEPGSSTDTEAGAAAPLPAPAAGQKPARIDVLLNRLRASLGRIPRPMARPTVGRPKRGRTWLWLLPIPAIIILLLVGGTLLTRRAPPTPPTVPGTEGEPGVELAALATFEPDETNTPRPTPRPTLTRRPTSTPRPTNTRKVTPTRTRVQMPTLTAAPPTTSGHDLATRFAQIANPDQTPLAPGMEIPEAGGVDTPTATARPTRPIALIPTRGPRLATPPTVTRMPTVLGEQSATPRRATTSVPTAMSATANPTTPSVPTPAAALGSLLAGHETRQADFAAVDSGWESYNSPAGMAGVENGRYAITSNGVVFVAPWNGAGVLDNAALQVEAQGPFDATGASLQGIVFGWQPNWQGTTYIFGVAPGANWCGFAESSGQSELRF